MTTAELAIVVTCAVGLGAPTLTSLFGWLREMQHARRERTAKDLDDLRALLDGLLPVMFEHTNGVLGLERWMHDEAFGRIRSDPAPRAALDNTRLQLYAANARLIIRRGREDVLPTALKEYLRGTGEAISEMDLRHEHQEPFDYADAELLARARRYWSAYEAFADACVAIVGSRSLD